MSVVLSLLLTLRTLARSPAALQIETNRSRRFPALLDRIVRSEALKRAREEVRANPPARGITVSGILLSE
jgi:hypothetical protein